MNDNNNLQGIDPPVYKAATAVFCNVKHYRRHCCEFKLDRTQKGLRPHAFCSFWATPAWIGTREVKI